MGNPGGRNISISNICSTLENIVKIEKVSARRSITENFIQMLNLWIKKGDTKKEKIISRKRGLGSWKDGAIEFAYS